MYVIILVRKNSLGSLSRLCRRLGFFNVWYSRQNDDRWIWNSNLHLQPCPRNPVFTHVYTVHWLSIVCVMRMCTHSKQPEVIVTMLCSPKIRDLPLGSNIGGLTCDSKSHYVTPHKQSCRDNYYYTVHLSYQRMSHVTLTAFLVITHLITTQE